jgi:hypothetical protein
MPVAVTLRQFLLVASFSGELPRQPASRIAFAWTVKGEIPADNVVSVIFMLHGDISDALIQERIRICEEACEELVRVSELCAEECLALTGDGKITECFLADLYCVEMGVVTARVLSWTTPANHAAAISVLEACVEACAESVIACEQVARLHPNWSTCTAMCHRVSNACTDLQVALNV